MPSAKRILSAVAAVSAWALATSGSATASGCANADIEVTGLSQGQMESSIACLINEDRVSLGLAPVQANTDLRRAALSHSAEMVAEGYFGHTSPDGVTFIDRIRATGYMRGARSWVVGENLVWGTGQLSTPDALVAAWMNSPPHRENLLRPRFRELGVGAAIGTPESRTDSTGVTVSSEYGYRAKAKKHRRARRGKRRRRWAVTAPLGPALYRD